MIKVKKNIKKVPNSLSNEKFDDAKKALNELYHCKCAYCEQLPDGEQIDHYRPVAKYQYLKYEWSNLLLSCYSCNKYKHAQFPMKNNRNSDTNITDIKSLNNIEEPFIINPEIDNPEEYFEYNEQKGEILVKNKNERAKKTINLCKLNRGNLKDRRKKKFDSLKNFVNYLTVFTLQKPNQKEKLKEFVSNLENKTCNESEYSALHKQIWNNFEKSIAPLFKDKQLIDYVLTEYRLIKTQC